MRIAFDFLDDRKSLTENEISYLTRCFQLLSQVHPEHEWIMIPELHAKGFASLLPVRVNKNRQVRKINPEILISTDPLKAQSSRLGHPIFFCSQQAALGKQVVQLKGSPIPVITTSAFIRKKLLRQVGLSETQIRLIPPAPREEVREMDWPEKWQIKEYNTEGREYFICFMRIANDGIWEMVLKAFSAFKKWQQTSVQLVLAIKMDPLFEAEFEERMATYKYRTDVKTIDMDDVTLQQLLPAAYGVLLPGWDATGQFMLNALKAGVPIITTEQNIFDESLSAAFLPVNLNADELARQIINLYRDERLRDTLIQRGKTALDTFTWLKTTNDWMETIGRVRQDEFN